MIGFYGLCLSLKGHTETEDKIPLIENPWGFTSRDKTLRPDKTNLIAHQNLVLSRHQKVIPIFNKISPINQRGGPRATMKITSIKFHYSPILRLTIKA